MFGETQRPKTWRSSLFIYLFIYLLYHHNFSAFPTVWFSIYFFLLRDSESDLLHMKHDALEVLGTFFPLESSFNVHLLVLYDRWFSGLFKKCRCGGPFYIPSRFTLFSDDVVTPCKSHVASRSPLADIISAISMYQHFERSASR